MMFTQSKISSLIAWYMVYFRLSNGTTPADDIRITYDKGMKVIIIV